MNWAELQNPNNEVSYTHVIAVTPIGRMIIDWKDWKENPDYSVTINSIWIGIEDNLDDAKALGKQYLVDAAKQLTEYVQ